VLGLLDLLGELDRLQGLGQRIDDLLVLLGLPLDHLLDGVGGHVKELILGGLILGRGTLRGTLRCGRLAAAHRCRVATVLRGSHSGVGVTATHS
jgi:hypothetical protein